MKKEATLQEKKTVVPTGRSVSITSAHPFCGSPSDLLVVTFLQRYYQVIQSKDWKTFLLEGGANNAVILTSRSGEFTEKYSGETARKTSGFEFKERERAQESSQFQ
jgi:hypothetical protein